MLVTRPMPDDDAWLRVVTAAVAGGVDWVQLREKDAPVERVAARLRRLREGVGNRAQLLVNHPRSLALAGCSDGIHLPEGGPPVDAVRRRLPPGKRVGRSVHSLAGAMQAEAQGGEYIVAGSIFATRSHPDVVPSGPSLLREIAGRVEIPLLAIGGVTPETARQCLLAGACGVAVLSAIMDAPDPRKAAVAFRRALGGHRGEL
jgi:thiamine-phosphate diphosphorylase